VQGDEEVRARQLRRADEGTKRASAKACQRRVKVTANLALALTRGVQRSLTAPVPYPEPVCRG